MALGRNNFPQQTPQTVLLPCGSGRIESRQFSQWSSEIQCATQCEQRHSSTTPKNNCFMWRCCLAVLSLSVKQKFWPESPAQQNLRSCPCTDRSDHPMTKKGISFSARSISVPHFQFSSANGLRDRFPHIHTVEDGTETLHIKRSLGQKTYTSQHLAN